MPGSGTRAGSRWSIRLSHRLGVSVVALLCVMVPAIARPAARYTTAYTTGIPDPPGDAAQLILTREQIVRVNRLKPEEITLDGDPVGVLPQKTYLIADIAPGRHCLHGLVEGDDLWFEAGEGRRYLIRLRETIDGEDHLRQEWLFDDPRMAARVVRQAHLPLARTTGEGLRRIEKHEHPVESRDPLPRAPGGRMTFTGILNERPLDPVNVRHEFADEPGTLVIEPSELRFAAEHRHIVIPLAAVVRIRYGGTRFSNQIPWIDVEYHDSSGGLRMDSFADSNPARATATYNQIFELLDRSWDGTVLPADAGDFRPMR